MMFDALLRPFPAFVGPVMPTMIAWQRAGEPGWPFHYPGGPMPGTINWVAGEQKHLPEEVLDPINYPKCGEQLALFGEEIA
jgi:hypothetical protein